MIIVTVDYLPNDNRKFCAKWRACRVDKFSEDKIGINEYAYKDKDVPDDFWKKHTIYYVDTQNENRLTKAYEFEDDWEDMQFTGDKFKLGVAGEITSEVLMQYLVNLVTTLNDKVTAAEENMDRLESKIDANTDAIHALNETVGENITSINNINRTVGIMQDDISLRATKQELREAVSILNTSIATLNTNINNMQNSINNQFNDVVTAMNNLTTRMTDLENNAVMSSDIIDVFDEADKG